VRFATPTTTRTRPITDPQVLRLLLTDLKIDAGPKNTKKPKSALLPAPGLEFVDHRDAIRVCRVNAQNCVQLQPATSRTRSRSIVWVAPKRRRPKLPNIILAASLMATTDLTHSSAAPKSLLADGSALVADGSA